MLHNPEDPAMNSPTVLRTISIIAFAAIAVGQFVTWPSIQVCVALSDDGRVCQGADTCCCGGHGTEAAAVEREADQASGTQPIANDCGCAQCFCKTFPAPAFLATSNGYAFSLPHSHFASDANLDIPVFNYSQSLFHPPRV